MDAPFTLRSKESKVRSPIRFTNNTNRNVNILWVNYVGDEVSYGVFEDGASPFVDSFVTHPWIAVDKESKQRLWLNSQDVFYPPAPRYIRIRDGQVARRHTHVYITVPVFHAVTLQELCCEAIADSMTFKAIDELPMPKFLKDEIQKYSEATQN